MHNNDIDKYGIEGPCECPECADMTAVGLYNPHFAMISCEACGFTGEVDSEHRVFDKLRNIYLHAYVLPKIVKQGAKVILI